MSLPFEENKAKTVQRTLSVLKTHKKKQNVDTEACIYGTCLIQNRI